MTHIGQRRITPAHAVAALSGTLAIAADVAPIISPPMIGEVQARPPATGVVRPADDAHLADLARTSFPKRSRSVRTAP